MSVFYWHAGLMVVAWIVLIPAGALIARFFKVRPGQDPDKPDDRFWWNAHRVLQSAGAALAAAGAWVVFSELDGVIDWSVGHVQLGVAALALCAAQIFSSVLRGTKGGPTDTYADPDDPSTWRGDHYDMTLRRRAFELWHKNLGYISMALAVCAVWTGIELIGLPGWTKWALIAAVTAFVAAFIALTRHGRRIDTWRAIWGPLPRAPAKR